MKRGLSLVTLSACAALAGASAQEPQQQQEQHVIASPNPTIDDSKTTAVEPGSITVTKVQPSNAATAAPMKRATKPKRKRKSSQ